MASNKMRNAQREKDDEMAVDMSPMIDMVFLLLIFFLVNATMIVVKMDKNVIPPVASNSKKQETANGRIVINIYKDGTYKNETGRLTFTDDDAMLDFLKKQKERVKEVGYTPLLHLRGDKESIFKYTRKVIRVAAAAGIDQVVFASYLK